MTTQNATLAKGQATTGLFAYLSVALIGIGIVFASGLAQAETLHDAAHDVRHATGFPCH